MIVLISGAWVRSHKRVTSDMTVLISGNWLRSYKRVISDITVLISGNCLKQLCLKLHMYTTYPKYR
jgi:predicted nucleotidyltransferase